MTTRNSHGLLQLNGKPWLTASKFYRANNALFVAVDLIGEKNQVILELMIKPYMRKAETLIDLIDIYRKENQGVFVKHYSMPPAATKFEKAIFSYKVKVKVTRSLTLVSFERASLLSMPNMKSLSLTVQKL